MKQGIEFGLGPQSNGNPQRGFKEAEHIGFCFARSLRPQCEIRGERQKAVNPGEGCGGDVGDIN